MSNQHSLLFNHINQNIRLNKFLISFRYTKFSFSFILFLYNENFVDFFYVKKNTLFFKLKAGFGFSLLKKIEKASSKNQHRYIKTSGISTVFPRNFGFLICSTVNGLATDKQAIKAKSGGLFVCYVF